MLLKSVRYRSIPHKMTICSVAFQSLLLSKLLICIQFVYSIQICEVTEVIKLEEVIVSPRTGIWIFVVHNIPRLGSVIFKFPSNACMARKVIFSTDEVGKACACRST